MHAACACACAHRRGELVTDIQALIHACAAAEADLEKLTLLGEPSTSPKLVLLRHVYETSRRCITNVYSCAGSRDLEAMGHVWVSKPSGSGASSGCLARPTCGCGTFRLPSHIRPLRCHKARQRKCRGVCLRGMAERMDCLL